VFILELRTSDLYSVLGRLLDHVRVAGLRLAAVSAWADAGEYKIHAIVDANDPEPIDRLARRVGKMVGVAALKVTAACPCADQTLVTATL
jgi:acetolactate synthase regulatory subunit